ALAYLLPLCGGEFRWGESLNVPAHLPPRRGKGEKREKMYQYLLRRLLIVVPTVLGISMVLFSILVLAPGNPFEELPLNPDIPTEVRLHLWQQFGLDDPLPLRYLRWLTAGCGGSGATPSPAG